MRVSTTSTRFASAIAALCLGVAACGGSDAASAPDADPVTESTDLAPVAAEPVSPDEGSAGETPTPEATEETQDEATQEGATQEGATQDEATPQVDADACPAPEATGPALQPGILAQFDTEAGQNTDGLAFDQAGNLYVSFAPLGQIARVGSDGAEIEVVGSIPGWDDPFPGIGGIAFDATGHLYAAVGGTETAGVWVFECGTGQPSRISGSETMGVPNDLVFDDAGNLFVSDLHSSSAGDEALGAVWRISPTGDVDLWAEDVLLGGTNSIGIGYIGANGLAIGTDSIYVAVSEKASIVEIAIANDGQAGPITVFAENDQLFFVEDVSVASDGSVYAVAALANSLLAVGSDGSIAPVDTPAGSIDQPANVLVAPGPGTDELIYVTNNARFSEQVDGVGSSVIAVAVQPS